jgi:phosphate transport system substrate-binding protein
MKKLGAVFAVVAVIFMCESSHAKDRMIQIKGSDTLINVVQKLAEVYMQKAPDTSISVTGGGSGTGIAALVNKKCDIANSSRTIKSSEVEQANAKGVDPKRVVIAIDALSIVVNNNNLVTKLRVDQIGAIYRGEVTDWSQVGGNNSSINLYGRQSNSGTYDFMKENVMKGEYSTALKSMNGNAQIVEAIKQDVSGIGYVGVGYVRETKDVKVLDVAVTEGMGYYSPVNEQDVKSGRYPITRPLNQYLGEEPRGGVKDFIEFELSKEGQDIIQSEGFFAIPDEYQRYNDQVLGRSNQVRERGAISASVNDPLRSN